MLQKARELSLECVERKRDNGLRWDIRGQITQSPLKKSVFILRTLATTKKVAS